MSYCSVLHTGSLPPPQDLEIASQNSSVIELQWNAPFSSANTKSDSVSVHVDPHITKYTVYITDKTTSKVVTHNTMETYYTFMTTDHYQCTSYQFCASASNAAGEGEKSGQVEGYFLQGDSYTVSLALGLSPTINCIPEVWC